MSNDKQAISRVKHHHSKCV